MLKKLGYIDFDSNKDRPSKASMLLVILVNIISESHALGLTDTTRALCDVIDKLDEEIRKNKLNEQQFDEISKFLYRVIKSDHKVLNEFLEIANEETILD